MSKYKESFQCYYYFNGWSNINFGISISLSKPNIEIHLPFGFIRIGICTNMREIVPDLNKNIFGYYK